VLRCGAERLLRILGDGAALYLPLLVRGEVAGERNEASAGEVQRQLSHRYILGAVIQRGSAGKYLAR